MHEVQAAHERAPAGERAQMNDRSRSCLRGDTKRAHIPGMNDTQHFESLRSEYRQRWDAYQVLAYRNAELAHAGQPPSPVQRADEQRAAVAVERARDELLAAVSRLGEQPTETGAPMTGTHN